MQTKTLLVVMFAVVFGLMAAGGAFLTQQGNAPKVETVKVVMAAVDFGRGASITPEMIKLADWPKDNLPEGALSDFEQVLGRTAKEPVGMGQMLLDQRLTAVGAGRGLPPLIPIGMRAITIQTPNVSTGVAGFVVPGNKVDVLLTMRSSGMEDNTGGGSTITLLQNIQVLAVDQKIDAPSENKVDLKELRSVTLLVTPAQAKDLDLGQNMGTMRLSLRNPLDETVVLDPPSTARELRNGYISDPTPAILETPKKDMKKPPENSVATTESNANILPKRPIALMSVRGTQVQTTVFRRANQIANNPPAGETPQDKQSDTEENEKDGKSEEQSQRETIATTSGK